MIALVATVTLHVVADEESERRMGDDAFNSGDYRNAVAFYTNALAQKEKHDWHGTILRLAFAKLYYGDLPGAKELLNDFCRFFPTASTGVLPGEIMVAEGKFDEAEKFFRNLVANAKDRKEVEEASFRLGELLLKRADFIGAQNIFSKLETGNSRWKQIATYEKIYAMMRNGNYAGASTALSLIPGKDRSLRHDEIELAISVFSGKLDLVRKLWPEIRKNLDPTPDARRFEWLSHAADLAKKIGDIKLEQQLLEDGFDFGVTEVERRNSLKKLINSQAENYSVAVDNIRRYLRLFPTASDCASLSLNGGRLLAKAGDAQGALDFFNNVMTDGSAPLQFRLEAALEGAAIAEKIKSHETVNKMYNYLVGHAPSSAERAEYRLKYGEYLCRQQSFVVAEKVLSQAIAHSSGIVADKCRFGLFHALTGQRKWNEAKNVAGELLKSSDKKYVSFGCFQLARVAEKLNNIEEARRLYLDFLKQHRGADYSEIAHFSAAFLAVRLKQWEYAKNEFIEFANIYSASAKAPEALYEAWKAARQLNDKKSETKIFERLVQNYPRSNQRVAVTFQNADELRNIRKYAMALQLLKPLFSILKGQPEEADLLLAEAKINYSSGNHETALEQLNKILNNYPSGSGVAMAALLAGTILYDREDFEGAYKYHQRALALQPSGIFGDVVRGRLIDCELEMYNHGRSELLCQTAAKCEKLAKESVYPGIKIQSCFKRGRAWEWAGNMENAIAAYEQVLYYANDFMKQGIIPEAEWCVRAVHAALPLYDQTSDAYRRKMRLIRIYEQLKLPDINENFEQLRQQVRKENDRR